MSYLSLLLMSITALMLSDSRADESLNSLLQGMRADTAVRIAYRETRTMALLEQPWQGSGYLYSLPPDLLIKEQLLPERVLMGVKDEQMLYFDPVNAVRHRGRLEEDSPLSLTIAVFKALINGDAALLQRFYRIQFKNSAPGWAMTLTSARDSVSGFNIVISGKSKQQIDSFIIQQADGELSELALHAQSAGDAIDAAIEHLSRELLGE